MGEASADHPRKVIIDCDPGHDDALAILLAAGDPRVDLLGVTTVAGNQTIERVTRNACVTATLAGLVDLPVFAGSRLPLLRPLLTAAEYHGESGLDGPAPIEPTVLAQPGHAVDFIVDTVLGHPGEVTLVALGPLTNIALALRRAPELAAAVDQVSIMGGSWTRGNATPAAEFNIYVDPEAAAIVFEAPWDVSMVGLDVTHQALYTSEVAAGIEAIGTPVSVWVGQLMDFFRASYQSAAGMVSPPLHDPCALAAVIDPTILTWRDALVEVETVGRYTAGMTVVDFDRTAPSGGHHVAIGIDVSAFWSLVTSAVAALPLAG